MAAGTAIIGYGNPLRGDDGVAWRVLERLQEEDLGTSVDLIACHQLTFELAEHVSHVERVIFVDATVGSDPGRISTTSIGVDPELRSSFSHHCDPAAVVTAAALLYGRYPEQSLIVAVEGAAFGYGEALSAPVLASIPEVVARLRELVTAPIR
jgi:hydrogenase maturation protease